MSRRHALTAVPLALVLAGGAYAGTAAPSTSRAEAATAVPVYLDPSYPAAERAADLVSRMTIDEKASQMISSRAAAVPRLGIAAFSWWNEAAHGVAREGTRDNANPDILTNTTSYPVDLSLGSTWDPALMYDEATKIADEAREVVKDNTYDLNFYSPTVNLARDPRWGRNDEAFSEDPLLTSRMAAQYVNGMEGKDRQGRLLAAGGGYLKTATTIKHYAANNSEYNRLTGSSDMDERTLREYYTKQFRDIVRESQPASIMSSYNRVNGVPASASVKLIDTLARETFGFEGFFTSDCDAVFEIQRGHKWQPAGYPHPLDEVERNAFANAAGEDLNCQQGYHDRYSYANTLPTAVARGVQTETGTYSEDALDVSLVRLFTTRIALGEFDGEARVPWIAQARSRVSRGTWTNSEANGAVTETPERLAQARRSADEAIVLLKNAQTTRKDGTKGTLLPLQVPATGAFKVAVVGWFAHPDSPYFGGYSSNQGASGYRKTVDGYQGLVSAIRERNPQAQVDFLPGVTRRTVARLDQASIDATAGYDAVVVYVGTDVTTGDEDVDRTRLDLPGAQEEMVKAVAAKNPNTIVYAETAGQFHVTGFEQGVSALLWSSYNGQRKGNALADVVLGKVSPSGHLPFTWYQSESQLPPLGDYSIRPSATSAGRTYRYFTGPVSYAFGHGLSYTTFDVGRVSASTRRLDANQTLTLTTRVTNTGTVKGAQVVQLYATQGGAAARAAGMPVKRLVGFQRVSLAPGQSTVVRFRLPASDLATYDEAKGRWVVRAGAYGMELATSAAAADVAQRVVVRVSGTLRPSVAAVTAKPVTQGRTLDVAQQVLVHQGDVIDPRVTVAMSDDTLYGYVTKGQSVRLPAGMRVSWSSSRPSVVAPAAKGMLRAVGPGVATVTARVSYRGTTQTGTFVLHVG